MNDRIARRTAAPTDQAIGEAFVRLERWGRERGWQGSDPYDGLNATRLVGPLKRSALGRRVLTQAVKRSPLDLRPLLGIAPARSAAATALVTSGYALQRILSENETEAKLDEALATLLDQRLPGYEQPCWGYHFDVQTGVFFYPVGAPNTIATAFAGLALLDAYERAGRTELLELARSVAHFFVLHVPQTDAERGAFFGYLVGDRTPIHNASMLVAALLARVARATGDHDLRRRAQLAVDYTVARQRPDGSWPYGEERHLAWVDNFHTAYVLTCLETCRRGGLDSCEQALSDGLRYYVRELFLPDGTPKYFPHSTYPIDGQCAAEAVRLFALATDFDPESAALAHRSFAYAERELARGDGAYVFQRRRLWTNRQPHIRWIEAPFLVALATLSRTGSP
ncbi:MAG: hypothetical protein ACRDV4_04220 [Acidimicrobiales bacterium]